MKPKDSRRIPLSCKYWWKGMAKTNYRKHKGRQRHQVLEEAIMTVTEGDEVYVEGYYNPDIIEDTCITCDRCGQYHSIYSKCKGVGNV